MQKITAAFFLSLALTIPAAMAQPSPTPSPFPSPTDSPSPAPTASPSPGATAASVQQQLLNTKALNFIHHTNQYEIASAQAATPKLTTQSVIDYAQQLITEHQASETQVTSVAGQAGVTLAPFQAATYEAQVNVVLDSLSGAGFERAWLETQIDAHQSALNELIQLQSAVTDPAVQTLISDTIPVVQNHLQEAATLLGQLPA